MRFFNVLNIGKCIQQTNIRLLSVSSNHLNKRVAVILSGCGVYDGAEITEAVSTMIHLSRHNASVQYFAPNMEQMHVVNHSTGALEPETRNVLVESARITRGNIKPLDKLVSSEFEALIVPGGFGAAKNLSDYAVNNTHLNINKDLTRVLNEFEIGKKPIGMCCITPVIAAKLFPSCEITVGKTGKDWPYAGTIDDARLLGARVVEKDVTEVNVDKASKLVTTPAFMKNASFFEVYTGIGKMVDEVVKLA